MKKLVVVFSFFSLFSSSAQQKITLRAARFIIGDSPNYKDPQFKDSYWPGINAGKQWEVQGYPDYNGYAWYRFHFTLPSSLKNKSYLKDSLKIYLGKIDDADVSFLNGNEIGSTGSFPGSANGYIGMWNTERIYKISANSSFLHWDKENVLAIKVYDGGGGGGMFEGIPTISMVDITDAISIYSSNTDNPKTDRKILISNNLKSAISGTLRITTIDEELNKTIHALQSNIQIPAGKTFQESIKKTNNDHYSVQVSFKEQHSGIIKRFSYTNPYILTPPAPLIPRINGAFITCVRPGSPFLYKIAATGKAPLLYRISKIPTGFSLDESTGIISGRINDIGNYSLNIIVTNQLGRAEHTLKVHVGNSLALTPPMGWNSWNCWGLSVNEEKVKASAQAMIDKGLVAHGWNYINIDDGWEAEVRNTDSSINSNNKFPDMKRLGDFLHSNGLKFGIYSSPGPRTCGGFLGSYKNEVSDAKTYSNWGIDYLKYDWCSYSDITGTDTSLAAYQHPYQVMQQALTQQPRDITYSLCQYGMKEVWKWGVAVNANCWRTTGDIEDTWESLKSIGFHQEKLYPYAGPGHWNDPDMLIIGKLGWGNNLRDTRLTPDEQYTHMSLWSLLAAPLLIGCDISKLDDFTTGLLTNDEVLAVDQDLLGKQAHCVLNISNHQVWMKSLEDGSKVIGIFNLADKYQVVTIKWKDLQLRNGENVRDLWRQKDLGVYKELFSSRIPPHGVRLIKVR